MSKPTILAPATMPALVLDQLAERYELIELAKAADPEATLRECADRVRGVVGQSTTIDKAFMQALPKLEVVSSFGVGYDKIDAAAAADLGVIVTNTPDVLNDEVADTTLALLLMTIRQLPQSERHLRDGKWLEGAFPLTSSSLQGRHIGIVGMGRIGEAIAHRLEAFGVTLSYHTRTPRSHLPYEYFEKLMDLAKNVDTLITIVPGGSATHHMINKPVLEALGENGVLINVARGTVVDEEALIQALASKTILSAGLDVYEFEPKVPQALLDMDHVVLLPHVGSASVPTRNAMSQLVVDNMVSWIENGTVLTPVAETPAKTA